MTQFIIALILIYYYYYCKYNDIVRPVFERVYQYVGSLHFLVQH